MFSCFSSKNTPTLFSIPVTYALIYVCVKGDGHAAFNGCKTFADLATNFKYKFIPPEQIYYKEIDAFSAAKEMYANENFFILTLKILDHQMIADDKIWSDINKNLVTARSFGSKDTYIQAPKYISQDPHYIKPSRISIPNEGEMRKIIDDQKKARKLEIKALKEYRFSVIRKSQEFNQSNINTLNQPDSKKPSPSSDTVVDKAACSNFVLGQNARESLRQ